MSNIFFIGDTHFCHSNLIKFPTGRTMFKSIWEHDEELIRRWNNTVNEKDVIYHLGDVIFNRNLGDKILNELKGIKKLILGNHDTYKNEFYLRYFTKLYGVKYFGRDCILTHIPIHPCQFPRFKLNIHGHLHHGHLPDKRYFNTCCDHWNFTPIPVEKIEERLREIS